MRRFGALIAAAALVLAACGSTSADHPSTGDQANPADSHETPSTLTQASFVGKVFEAVIGSGSAKVHFSAGSGASVTSGDGLIKYGKPLAIKMTMTGKGGPTDAIVIGAKMYLSMGSTGKYMSMNMTDSGAGMPNLGSAFDPDIQRVAFEKAIVAFEQKGAAETLDGVQALPYVITIDPKKAPDSFGTLTTKVLTFTYFIGPDDLPRKMVYSDTNGTFTATYSDWGAPVTIDEPVGSQIVKLPGS